MAKRIDKGYAKPEDPIFNEPFLVHLVPSKIAERIRARQAQAEPAELGANVSWAEQTQSNTDNSDDDNAPPEAEPLDGNEEDVWFDSSPPPFTAKEFRAHWATICEYLPPEEQPEMRRNLLAFHGLTESDLTADSGAA